jgi:hypothetical protein
MKKEKEVREKQPEGHKPLGTPIPNRFLLMLVKNHIKNND